MTLHRRNSSLQSSSHCRRCTRWCRDVKESVPVCLQWHFGSSKQRRIRVQACRRCCRRRYRHYRYNRMKMSCPSWCSSHPSYHWLVCSGSAKKRTDNAPDTTTIVDLTWWRVLYFCEMEGCSAELAANSTALSGMTYVMCHNDMF